MKIVRRYYGLLLLLYPHFLFEITTYRAMAIMAGIMDNLLIATFA